MRPRLLLAAAATAAALVALGRRLLRSTVTTELGRVEILDPGEEPGVRRSGAVGSVQEAEITVGRDLLERIWTPASLEQLARGYWTFLRRFTLGIVRVVYAHEHRTVTAFGRFPLLRFGTPAYEAGPGSGRVTWPIEDGLLVAREGRGRGYLRVSVRRCDRDGVDDEADARPQQVRIIARVEVQSFYPGLRGRGAFARFGTWFYAQTQLRIHVIACNAYLLSLARLDFPGLEPAPANGPDRELEPSEA